MKLWKRALTLLTCLALTCALLPLSANAATSGSCGNGVSWRFTASTGTLKITGSGEMDDYYGYAPWYENDLCDSITAVSIASGVTYIGAEAFYDCTNLTSITLPVSVTCVGDYAFEDCSSLTTVNYAGTAAQFRAISLGEENYRLLDAYFGNGEHNWVIPDPSDTEHYEAADCENDGWYTKYCSNCGEEGNTYIIDALGHNWVAGTPVPATCEDDGYTPVTCSRCGETDEINIVEATGHNWVPADPSDPDHYEAPTCEDSGWYVELCSVCGEVRTWAATLILPLGHDWVAGTPLPPTCEDDGYTLYICTRCNAEEVRLIFPATGHNWVPADPSDTWHYHAASCGEDGWYWDICSACGEIGEYHDIPMPQDHFWVPADPSDPDHYCAPNCVSDGWYDDICAICGTIGESHWVDALGHDWVTGTPVPPTCEDDGYTPLTCSRCGATDEINIVPATDHSWAPADPSDTNYYCAATCGEDGWYWDICSVCGAIGEYHDIPMPQDHFWVPADPSDPAHYQAPDCVSDGWYDDICLNCGETGATHTIPPLNHNWVAGTPVSASCEDYGYTPVTCSRCGETDEINIVPATDHSWASADPSDSDHYCAASCEEAGWYDMFCTVCGDERPGRWEIPPLGHDWVPDAPEPATCTEYGFTLYTCSRCGAEEERDIVPATGHSWAAADPSDTAHYCAADCESAGWYDDLCTACGAVGAEHVIPALDHDLAYTDNGDGTHSVSCSRCDYSATEEHSFVNGSCVCGAAEAAPAHIASAYPVLNEDIDLVCAVSVPAGAEPYMIFTYQGTEYTVTDYTVNGNGQYCFAFTGITPQCMGEAVTAVLHAGDATDTVDNYSIRQYCVNMLSSHADDTALVTLLSDLLTYGAAAQQYTGYHTNSLVTAGLDLTPSAFSAISGKAVSFSGTADAATDWISAGLLLGNTVTMRFTFAAASVEGLTVRVSVNGREEVFDADDFTADSVGKYYVDFTRIEAIEFDDAVTATFYRSNAPLGRSVTYSVNAYLCGTQNSENTALQALVRALYNYGASALAYSAAE